MVNDRQSLDLTTFAAPADSGAVEWLISDRPIPYPEAIAAMEARVATIAADEAPERVWLLEHPALYGVAINVEPDLTHFAAIVPCGVSDPRYGVTSLADLGHPVSMAEVDIALRQAFEEVFGSASMRVPDATM